MRHLSKSKIIAFRQCPKRLWLEVHRKELRDDSASEMVFAIGNQVGEVAQTALVPKGQTGTLCDPHQIGWDTAYALTASELTKCSAPILEATMKSESGALALADVMLPSGNSSWDMIEVKSSTTVKDYHRDDVAIQSFVFRSNAVLLNSVGVATINNQFVYQGDGDYAGLFTVSDFTEEAARREDEVIEWIASAQTTVALEEEPCIETGPQCHSPFTCPFLAHCNKGKVEAEYPVSSLPRIRKTKIDWFESQGIIDLREVPDSELNDQQRKVKRHSISGKPYFDQKGAASALSGLGSPAYFLDFETVNFAVPIWKGTRPYQQVPFQYSLHTLDQFGAIEHTEFLDLSGDDPSEKIAKYLVQQCGTSGPVLAYNASFEIRVMNDLAKKFPQYADGLELIIGRVVDLLPVARDHYYHPSQHGSWSIKAVLPAACPDLSYGDLDGVADGNMAIGAFTEAIDPATDSNRKQEIDHHLREYCKLDTFAMVRLWKFFRGQ